MSDLRKAVEMALNHFDSFQELNDAEYEIVKALRQALAHEALDRMVAENERLGLYYNKDTVCKDHPDAPHSFNRNASLSENRYVCDCEYWEPPKQKE